VTAIADLGFADRLRDHGDRLALVAPDGTRITYRGLDDRVSDVAERLGPVRRLVFLAAANDVESVVAYLAALRGRHPVLLTGHDQLAALAEVYDPDVVVDGGWDERRPGTAHELHPDLALLLSTSGTTGSPKLVRLSADNLAANAAAIAEYLDIRSTDRPITSLPMHYCYGLSVLNSNLLRGAGLVLTDRSVVDPAFWTVVRDHHVTSLHGVPHTFDLLDTVGFDRMDLPGLRYVTQAGGRLDPAAVVRYAELGERRGWRFFVMYGQTEATARMAYLPPELARTHPSAIGIPVPGGDFDLVDGELVYRGPNVMLGYATGPEDLALGRTTVDLPTGDLGRRTPDGLYEVVGRKRRFVKPFGLRVDLDQVERVLADDGIDAAATGTDDVLVVAVRGGARRAGALVRTRFGLPATMVRVAEFPRLPNGKVDYRALADLGRADAPTASVRETFAAVLGLRDVPGDATFVSLGGDSLNYVRMSVALERLLGHLPDGWQNTPVAELEERRRPPRLVPAMETDIVLRALAIVLIVGSHIRFFGLEGGAHLLLAIAGWNFARFVLPGGPGRILRATAVIAAPAVAWLAYRAFVTDDVTLVNVVLVNNFARTGAVGYWFIEVLVHTLLVLAAVFAIPAVRRAEQTHAFTVALAALVVLSSLRLATGDTTLERTMTTLGAAWFVALGWLLQRADTPARKLVAGGLALAVVPFAFGDLDRRIIVTAGLVLLLTVPRLPVPRPAVPVVSAVASASLGIYLTHYAVFPALQPHLPPVLVVVLSIAAGVVAWQGAGLVLRQVRRPVRGQAVRAAWRRRLRTVH
jgi:acyl-CoA synthetase (AMP-forming)/AMP-acid ligase II